MWNQILLTLSLQDSSKADEKDKKDKDKSSSKDKDKEKDKESRYLQCSYLTVIVPTNAESPLPLRHL